MAKRVMGIIGQRDEKGNFCNEQPIYCDYDESEELTEADKRACDEFAKWLCQMFIQSKENS